MKNVILLLILMLEASCALFGADTVRIDRRDGTGRYYDGVVAGDTLTSPVMDIGAATSVDVTFRARRVYPAGHTHRRWADDTLRGPEIPVAKGNTVHGDTLVVEWFTPSSGWTRLLYPIRQDSIRLPEFTDAFRSYTYLVTDDLLPKTEEDRRGCRYRIILRGTARTSFDDEDPFDVTEHRLLTDQQRDLVIEKIELPNSWSILPYHQTTSLPFRVRVANRARETAKNVKVMLRISQRGATSPILEHRLHVDSLAPYSQVWAEVDGVDLSSVLTRDLDTLDMFAVIDSSNGVAHEDIEPANDRLLRIRPIRRGRTLAYDNYEVEGHHVVANELGVGSNFGITAPGSSIAKGDSIDRYGGIRNPTVKGPWGISMAFRLNVRDTLTGYQFAFDRTSVRDSVCEVMIRKVIDSFSAELVSGTQLTFRPGLTSRGIELDSICTYELPASIVLDTGLYEMHLIQHSPEPLNLCATASRAAIQCLVADEQQWGLYTIADPSWYLTRRTTFFTYYKRDAPTFPFATTHQGGSNYGFVGHQARMSYTYNDVEGTSRGEHTYRQGTWIPVMRAVLGGAAIVTTVSERPSIPTGANPIRVELWTLQGQLVWMSTQTDINTIDRSQFSSGVYAVRTVSELGASTKLIVID